MGGGKKRPTVSQLEKRVTKEEKKKEEGGKKPQMKLEASTGNLTEVSLEHVIKEIRGLKYVTPYVLASKFSLKLSRAKKVLRELESRGVVVAYDKNSRVPIYVPVAKSHKKEA
ncbi:30S ribosomal protein S25e [Thermofilum pendens]|uniref:SSU ribosomal protein S25E n=1 Tax=Thermofilum pendens (strain DSM 2475 / Hrk 5) TaxID=368408 RepID=A1RYY6_THEPD|nr:30S ribosomal protein S25e [Thermofilum pendens]ABL78416.1 SSU ribosomal protein S25E [Thermofilum pendens Hrk 5]